MDPKLLAAIIAVLMGLASVLGAVATYIKSSSEVGGIKADRERTKNERDTKIALLEQKCDMLSKRLDDGQAKFDRIDEELKAINKSLITIITKVDTLVNMSNRSHSPEEAPL